jgi:diadenosine tetraphosphate (Ap4A) HIT family hydrolase
MADCIFCSTKKENIVFNTDNFYVKIGKGIICEGHCMIISNKHCTCIAESCVDFMDEFLFLKEKLIQFLSNNFFEPFVVEHGAVMQSVFHGHMHFIPLKSKEYDKLSLMDEMVLSFIQNNTVVYEKINSFNELVDIFNKDKEYLYFEENKEIYIVRTKHNQNIFDDIET